jgi:hypothetical protein
MSLSGHVTAQLKAKLFKIYETQGFHSLPEHFSSKLERGLKRTLTYG